MTVEDDAAAEIELQKKTILFLARLLVKTIGQRDRARDLAARLEQELADGKRGAPSS